MSDLLIGITSFGRKKYTELCLKALEEQEIKDNVTTIIGDNGSNSEVVEFLKQYDGKVSSNGIKFKVIFSPINLGVGKMLNQILNYRTTDQHFCKLDNDTIFPSFELEGFIKKDEVNKKAIFQMIDFIENQSRFKSVAAYFYNKDRSTAAPTEFIKTNTGNTYEIENPHNHMLGACIFFHKDVMNNLKKFDETRIYGFEDTIFSQKSLQFGENAWAKWLNPGIAHVDDFSLPESREILEIKRKSLSRELKVP
jgi:GT2 family glycosyltransferase